MCKVFGTGVPFRSLHKNYVMRNWNKVGVATILGILIMLHLVLNFGIFSGNTNDRRIVEESLLETTAEVSHFAVSDPFDLGSVGTNDSTTSRDYKMSFMITSHVPDLRVKESDIEIFVEGPGGSSAHKSLDSTANEHDGEFAVGLNDTETFTVTVSVWDVSTAGQYRVGISSVKGMVVPKEQFRSSWRTINKEP